MSLALKIYKLVLKLDNVLWLRKYLVRILGHYTLKYSESYFFGRGTISNLVTLFYASQRLTLFYRIGPRFRLFHLRVLSRQIRKSIYYFKLAAFCLVFSYVYEIRTKVSGLLCHTTNSDTIFCVWKLKNWTNKSFYCGFLISDKS